MASLSRAHPVIYCLGLRIRRSPRGEAGWRVLPQPSPRETARRRPLPDQRGVSGASCRLSASAALSCCACRPHGHRPARPADVGDLRAVVAALRLERWAEDVAPESDSSVLVPRRELLSAWSTWSARWGPAQEQVAIQGPARLQPTKLRGVRRCGAPRGRGRWARVLLQGLRRHWSPALLRSRGGSSRSRARLRIKRCCRRRRRTRRGCGRARH